MNPVRHYTISGLWLAASVGVLLFCSSVGKGSEIPRALDDCNVIFETPSTNAVGAVHIGNGEMGASVWIEPNGDVVLYLARPDSFSEACRLLKLGRVRISFSPAPPTTFGSFYQELKLRQGRLEADVGSTHLEIFVQPDRPVLRIVAQSVTPFAARVSYEGWRRERRVLNGTLELNNSGWTMQGGPSSIPVIESADVVVSPEQTPGALAFYHHNTESVVPASLRLQSCDQLSGAFDPLIHRTFGAWIEGPKMRRAGADVLEFTEARTNLDLRIACPSLICTNVSNWLDLARKHAVEAPEPGIARALTEAWWQEFWARSWVLVDQPSLTPNPLPLVIGRGEAGQDRFAGAFGRVSIYSRALTPAEVVQLAIGGPTNLAPVKKHLVLSVTNPPPGHGLPDSAGLDLTHGFTLEAWIRPSNNLPAFFFAKGTQRTNEALVFETTSGGDLRLRVGKSSITPPSVTSLSTTSASHVFNSLSSLNDQEEIRSSHDLGIGRFTWWDHRGTREWVQYELKEPVLVSRCEVYWFDDTPLGGACRVPKSWRILYRDSAGTWQPVNGETDQGLKPNVYNSVSFQPVRTSALRLDVQLHTNYSGGILEWRVSEAEAKPILRPGVWQHVAATCYPHGLMTLYHNGTMVAHKVPSRATPLSQAYILQRYMNACQGRGEAPIKFNGGMFTVEPQIQNPKLTGSPDWRLWGDGYWFQNTRHMYHSMLACGDADLMAPFFDLYRRALPLAQARAKSWYGTDGAFFPETMSIFGAYPNGDYGWNRQGRKPGDVWVTAWKHAWNQGPELVALMLDRWDYTEDSAFLRNQLLPMATAVLGYFDTRFRKEHGRIVIDPTQAVETFRTGVLDDMPVVAGLRAITARLCELPAHLLTGEERQFFARMREACPLLPMEDKRIQGGTRRCLAPARTFKVEGWNCESAEFYAVWPFRLYGVGRPDLELARTTYRTRRYSVDNGWGYDGNVAAVLGLTDEAARIVQERCRNSHPAYRFPATWGPNFDWLPDQNHGGNLMVTMQFMLMQPVGKKIYLLPAWPPGLDVSFRLHAPGQTVVEGRLEGKKLTRLIVEPESRRRDIEICAPFAEAMLKPAQLNRF